MSENSKLETEVQSKCTTFNFTVPSVFWIWTMIIIISIVLIINYLITFRIWIFEKSRPTENFYNENDYYKQY